MATRPQSEHRPDKKFDMKTFLIIVITGAVLVGAALLLLVGRKAKKLEPGPGTTHPTSRLVVPARAKAVRAEA